MGRCDNWAEVCDIHILVDGTDTVLAGAWAPCGLRTARGSRSRVAWTDTPDDIFVMNLADGSVTNLTHHPARDWGPRWSRDGGKIAFVSDRDGPFELYVMDTDGANPTRLTHNVGLKGPFDWSPDGGRIAFASDRDGAPELYVMDADGSNLTRLTNSMGFMGTFDWSPEVAGLRSAAPPTSASSTPTEPTSSADARSAGGSEPARDGLDPANCRHGDRRNGEPIARGYGSQVAWSPDGSQLAFVGTHRVGFGPLLRPRAERTTRMTSAWPCPTST